MTDIIWGMVLKADRERAGLTVDFVAEELGLKISAIRRYEGANPRSKTYKKGAPTDYVTRFYQLLEHIKQ